MATSSYDACCVACLEPIQSGARRCPHCHAPQSPRRWQLLRDALKWIGGITAVFSLFLVAQQVTNIVGPWMDRYVTAKTLLDAATMQSDAGDYPGAWALLDEALALNPGSTLLHAERVTLAMAWVRNPTNVEDIEALLPSLYVGAVRGSPPERADALAHIARVNVLRASQGQDNLNIDRQFEDALKTDANNIFALTWLAHWRFEPANRGDYVEAAIQTARSLFERALATGDRQHWVRELQLETYLSTFDPDAKAEAIRVVLQIKSKDGVSQNGITAEHARRFKRQVHDLIVNDDQHAVAFEQAALEILGWPEIREAYVWVRQQYPKTNATIEHFVLAKLTELAGDENSALDQYRALLDEGKTGYAFSRDLVDSVDRLSR